MMDDMLNACKRILAADNGQGIAGSQAELQ